MNDRNLNLLIAVPGSDDSVSGAIRDAIEQDGLTVERCDFRTGMTMIMQYLSSFPDTDAVILSQYQGTVRLKPADVDNISMTIPDLKVILIVQDNESGNTYMRELESYGLYMALFEKDADYISIVNLIRGGRSKKEARLYYGVAGGDVTVQTSEFSADNAVAFLSAYNGSIEDLTGRLVLLSDRLTNSLMLEVLAALPKDLFIMVSRIERYSTLCGLVEEQRHRMIKKKKEEESRLKVDDSTNKASKKKKQKKEVEPKKLSTVEILKMEGKRGTRDVGFISTNVGVGCTTSAILFAHSIARSKKGIRVAIVEFDNADANFEALCRVVTGERNISGLTKFTVGDVDYYFNLPYSKFGAQYKPIYDVVVYDFGCCSNETVEGYFLRLHTKFVVSSAKEWHYGELVDFISEVSPLDINDSFIYLFPCIADQLDMGALLELLPEKNTALSLPYEANPYVPGKLTSRLFVDLLNGTSKPKKYNSALSITEKAARRVWIGKWKRASIGLAISFAISVAGFGSLCIMMNQRYRTLSQQSSDYVAELMTEIEALIMEKGDIEQQFLQLDQTVYLLKQEVAAGTIITKDMTIEKTIKTGLSEELFLKEEDIGEIAAGVAINEDTPLLYVMVAEPVEEIEEIPEDLLNQEEPN